MIQVFLDANVYFAGFYSAKGASRAVLELAKKRKIQIIASGLVLKEADRNLRKKTDAKISDQFRRFLKNTKIIVVPPPTDTSLQPYTSYTNFKDIPVLAAAFESKAHFLVTLDRKHFFTSKVLSLSKKTKIVTPGELLRILK